MTLQNSFVKAVRWLADELGIATMRTAGLDVYLLIMARYLRLFAYGAVALILAIYFEALGFSDEQIGLFMTLTLLGDVLVSLCLTLVADALGRRRTLLLGAIMMAISGAVFASTGNYAALLIAAIVGVISPSGNEIGPFRAVEESTLAHLVPEHQRSDVFTWYVVLAVLGTSSGLLVGGFAIDHFQTLEGWTALDAYRAIFWVYTGVGCIKALMTLFLSRRCEHEHEPLLQGSNSATMHVQPPTPIWKRLNPFHTISKPSQLILLKLCSIFFLDSLGSGMVPFSLINLFMERKFGLEKGKLGSIMSATWFVSTIGNVFASSVAKRLGLIQAMVATHLPSSIFLALLPVPPVLSLTVCLLVGRAILNSMDQAPRSAFLSLVVQPEERTAVMGIVNILKTLSQSSGPTVTGILAGRGRFWVAFVVAGSLKATYDLALLAFFAGRIRERKGPTRPGDAPDDQIADPVSEAEASETDARTADDSTTGTDDGTNYQGIATHPFPDSLSSSPGTNYQPTPKHYIASSAIYSGYSVTSLEVITNSCSAEISPYVRPCRHALLHMASILRSSRSRILYLDAYDSFSNNIVAQVKQCVDADVIQIYIDDPRFGTESICFTNYLKSFDAVIAGPGPGWASIDEDVGLIKELWNLQESNLLPVFGICLGFQSLALAFGAQAERLNVPRHGLVAEILHNGCSIFEDVYQLRATQYHSLQVNIGHSIQTRRAVTYPAELWTPTAACPLLEPLAWDFDSQPNGAVLMAVKHIQKPFWGVQFHPESICTNSEGTRIIRNWWAQTQAWIRKRSLCNLPRAHTSCASDPAPLALNGFTRSLYGYRELSDDPQGRRGDHSSNTSHVPGSGDGAFIERFLRSIGRNGTETPLEVQCATTGSGRLTVSDIADLFDIPRMEAIILESGLQPDLLPMKVGTGRYSIIGLVIPKQTVRIHYYTETRTFEIRDGKDWGRWKCEVTDPWMCIKNIMKHLRPNKTPSGPTFAPFWGGLMGYASYEAGLETIGVPVSGKAPCPDICFAYIRRSIVIDHHLKKIYIQSLRPEDSVWIDDARERLFQAAYLKSQAGTPNLTPSLVADPFDADATLNNYLSSCEQTFADKIEYCASVSQAQASIADGQSYELCLTTPNTIRAHRPASCLTSPASNNELSWGLYKRLTTSSPAPFSAYFRLHNIHALSSSPERFISWNRAQAAQCRPIKGTVRKGPGVTKADAEAILNSSKERAENLMIVDLTRHQLHGVYGAENVVVSQLMQVEEYEKVYQLVSVIDAIPTKLKTLLDKPNDEWHEHEDDTAFANSAVAYPDTHDGNDELCTNPDEEDSSLGIDAFIASLPPGSMTGAPKKRSCELLQTLEHGPRRGMYAGVMGYLDVGGGGDFSVIIRTAVKVDAKQPSLRAEETDLWTINAGGAITAQSTPESEFEEMRTKLESVAQAFRPETEDFPDIASTPNVRYQHRPRFSRLLGLIGKRVQGISRSDGNRGIWEKLPKV
ncbi:para-aminobenzoate synthase [Lophiostoma macrostomum CBS 122681]|uniref:p-aminobenzoic acid synthase n=1 Tax=Lophiostoma macrostomum CBS 122681 TaxID=1314788 RepID=A0A6A6TML6_9PLEO|nr:para-aminobenzoate synthase [Lophiostoma macrostomum CBS 122681]